MNSTPHPPTATPPTEALVAELIKAHPDSAHHIRREPSHYDGGCWLAFEQQAWMDVSWGWQANDETPHQGRCTDPEFKPCPLGGRFIRSSFSIGD